MNTPSVNPNPSRGSQLSAAEFGVSEGMLTQLLFIAKKGAPYAGKTSHPSLVCDAQLRSSVPGKAAVLSRAIFKSLGVSGEGYQERDLRIDDISDALCGPAELLRVADSHRESGFRSQPVITRDESLFNATVIFLDNVNFAKPSSISTIERYLARTINDEQFPNLKVVWLGMGMRPDEVAEEIQIKLPRALLTRVPRSYDLDNLDTR